MAGAGAGRTRVLHIALDLNAGGLERLIADLVRRGTSEKFEFHVLALRFLGRHADGLEQFARLHVGPPMEPWSLLWPRRLGRQVRAIAPDVIHSHSGVWLKVARAASLADRPYHVHTDHGRNFPESMSNRWADRLASCTTDVVIGVSEPLSDYLCEHIVLHRGRVRTIPNGIDTELLSPGHSERGRLAGVPEGAAIIGSVGRFEPIKGYDIVLDAFARFLATDGRQIRPRLVLVGEGGEEARLRSQAVALGVADHVTFAGWQRDVVTCYRSFTIFTLGSRSEGTSLGLLEAMSCGVVPVVTDVGGNRAVLGPGLEHRLVRPLDPDALAEGWRRALREHDQWPAERAAARLRVVEHFSLSQMIAAYEAIYLERRHSRG